MELEPITRKEKIIAGENLEPITRLEKFLKEYGGSGGSGGGGSSDAVLYTAQTLTDAQKKQARVTLTRLAILLLMELQIKAEQLRWIKRSHRLMKRLTPGKMCLRA